MGTGRATQQDHIPPFARIRTANGVTDLRIGAVFATWLKRALWTTPLWLILGVAAIASLASLRPDGGPWSAWLLPIEILLGFGLLLLVILAFICAIVANLSGEVIWDGQTLRFQDQGRRYRFAIDDVRAIRLVTTSRLRRVIDSSAGPRGLFCRRLGRCLEIEVREGRIRFFKTWGMEEVDWIFDQLARLPAVAERIDRTPTTEGGETGAVILANRMYGRSHWLLLAFGAIMFAGFATFAGWNAYRARASFHWPSTTAQVTHSHYEEHQSSDSTTYVAEITYRYTVLGTTYESSEIGIMRSNDESAVREVIVTHPEGSTVNVHYNPNAPADAMLLPGISPLSWLLAIPVVLLPLLFVPAALQSNTRAQGQLAARYIEPHSAQRTAATAFEQLSATIRWEVPEDAWRHMIATSRRSMVMSAVRIAACVVLLLWATHHWFAPLCPPDLPWGRLSAILMGITGFQVLMALASGWLVRTGNPPKYALTSEGLLTQLTKQPLIRWSRIASMTVLLDIPMPGHRTIVLHKIGGVQQHISLPSGEQGDAVLSQMRTRIPLAEPPAKARSMTRADWAAGALITVTVIVVGGEWLARHVRWAHHSVAFQWIMLSGFVVGPGTWMAAALWRRRGHGVLLPMAVALNMLATLGLLVYAILARLLA
jgi:hypothetical protein